jgi:hypothetical protein
VGGLVVIDDGIERLLASAEATLQAEDDRIDSEELRAFHAEFYEKGELIARVWDRAAEVKTLRAIDGKQIGKGTLEMLEWLYRDMQKLTDIIEGKVRP